MATKDTEHTTSSDEKPDTQGQFVPVVSISSRRSSPNDSSESPLHSETYSAERHRICAEISDVSKDAGDEGKLTTTYSAFERFSPSKSGN